MTDGLWLMTNGDDDDADIRISSDVDADADDDSEYGQWGDRHYDSDLDHSHYGDNNAHTNYRVVMNLNAEGVGYCGSVLIMLTSSSGILSIVNFEID